MANSVDFRADQLQVNKIVVTGSNGSSNEAVIVYGISNQTTPLNQGYIDPDKFSTGSIGSDVFFYVSGGIDGRGVTGGAVSVFGGDLHISGNLTVDGTYPGGGGGGGTPGGSIGQVQYNAGSGNFGGLSSLTYTGGTLHATGSFSGSFQGSFSGTANNAVSASYATNALTASYAAQALSASVALSSIQWQDGGNKLATTSSLALAGDFGTGYFADNVDPAINLFVSGTAVVGKNLVVSGTLQTDHIIGTTLAGGTAVFDYIELPNIEGPALPANPSTFLYTSGSSNDLFISHNSTYSNTTNFRWVENSLGTGLLQGGILSTEPGTTTFSVTAGKGILVSYNATTTSEPDASIVQVDWDTFTSQSLTYIGTDTQTFIGISNTGALFQQTTPFTSDQYALYIPLGRILHVSGSTTYGIANEPRVAYGQSTWNGDFIRAFGPLKLSGHVLEASGSTLGLIKSGGSAYVEGKNYAVDPNSPNLVLPSSDGPVTVSKVFRQYVSGSDSNNIVIDTNGGVGFTEIDPNNYNPDNAGTLTPVTSGKITNQRVYWAPNTSTNAFWVYYGSDEYNSFAEAQAAIPSEMFTEGENTIGATILVANLLVASGATDLSNPAQAQFIPGGLFRGSGTGIGGAGGATLPGGIDTYVQFNDGGSTFGGDVGFTYNKTTNTMTVSKAVATTITASTGVSSSGTLSVGGNTILSTATGSFSGSYQGNLTGTASYADSAGNATLLDGLHSYQYAQLAASNTFAGDAIFQFGLSGSLQKLSDGTPYLAAGPNVTINTASNGQVRITGSIGGTNTQLQYNNNGVFGGVPTITYNGTTLQATGSFSGSLAGTASYANNAGLLNNLADTAFAKLGSANTFTANNTFTTVTASTVSSSGNVSAQGNLLVQGTSQFTGSAFFGNNVTLGSTAANVITVTGQMTASNLRATGSFSGPLAGTASYATNAGLLNNLADTAFAKLGSANTFTAANAFTSVTATSLSSSGNVSAQGNLLVQGTSQFTGSAFFGGNVTLGDTSADIITVNGQMTASNLRATGSFSGSFAGVPTLTTSTWSPTITFSGGGEGGGTQTKVGTYVKIGQLVTATFSITMGGTPGTGNVTLTGLPFTSQTTTGVAGSVTVSNFQNVGGGLRVIAGTVNSNATTATLRYVDTSATDMLTLTATQITSTTILQGTVTYVAAS